jgi:hypothetical protein
MKKYKVEITETLQRIVEIEATSAGKAVQKIRKQYKEEEIVLSENDFVCCQIDYLENFLKTNQLINLLKDNPSKLIEVVLLLNSLNATHFIMFENNIIVDEGIDGVKIKWNKDEFKRVYSSAVWKIDYSLNEIDC